MTQKKRYNQVHIVRHLSNGGTKHEFIPIPRGVTSVEASLYEWRKGRDTTQNAPVFKLGNPSKGKVAAGD